MLGASQLFDITAEDENILEGEDVHDVVFVDNEVEGVDDEVDTKFEIINEVKVGLGLITFGRIMFAESAVNSGAVYLVV